jgi:hypothetical protein
MLGAAASHLPGNTESILEPSTGLRGFVTAGRQLLPVVVHLILGVASHLQGDRLVECEQRPAIERRKSLPLELERNAQHAAGNPAVDLSARFPIVADGRNFGIPKDRAIKARRLLGLSIEPQARADFVKAHSVLLARTGV